MNKNKKIFINPFQKDQFIEIFELKELDDSIFDNYQRYDFFQVLWFTKVEGNDIYFLDFNEYKIKKDQIILVFPGQIDKLDIEGKEGYLFAIHGDNFFNINQRLNSDYLNGYFSNILLSINDETKKILEKLFELIKYEYNSENRIILMESYMESFLFHVSSLFESTETYNNKTDLQVSELMKLIDKNFITERETEFYAEQFGFTSKKLNQICIKGTGKTIKQHLKERLILEIKKEIRLGNKSIKEIAFELGFSEPAYLTRFFKQQTGIIPTQFK